MKALRVDPALLLALLSVVCMEPGVWPVSGPWEEAARRDIATAGGPRRGVADGGRG